MAARRGRRDLGRSRACEAAKGGKGRQDSPAKVAKEAKGARNGSGTRDARTLVLGAASPRMACLFCSLCDLCLLRAFCGRIECRGPIRIPHPDQSNGENNRATPSITCVG